MSFDLTKAFDTPLLTCSLHMSMKKELILPILYFSGQIDLYKSNTFVQGELLYKIKSLLISYEIHIFQFYSTLNKVLYQTYKYFQLHLWVKNFGYCGFGDHYLYLYVLYTLIYHLYKCSIFIIYINFGLGLCWL